MTRLILTLLAACAVSGCATSSSSKLVDVATTPVDPAAFALGSGDKLRITVFGEQKLSGDYAVSNTGRISFPLIGNIEVRGKTLEEVQAGMRDKLAAGYLQDPRIAIEIINYRPFYILGEVMKPGEYPYVAGLTLEQAIATAGGYTYRAKQSRVVIKGAAEPSGRELSYRDQKIFVQPGDTIRIPERFF